MFTSKAPALGAGLEQGPRLGCTHSPAIPGATAAGDRDEADRAGGRGSGRRPGLLQSSARPEDKLSQGVLKGGFTLGAS